MHINDSRCLHKRAQNRTSTNASGTEVYGVHDGQTTLGSPEEKPSHAGTFLPHLLFYHVHLNLYYNTK